MENLYENREEVQSILVFAALSMKYIRRTEFVQNRLEDG